MCKREGESIFSWYVLRGPVQTQFPKRTHLIGEMLHQGGVQQATKLLASGSTLPNAEHDRL